MFVLLALVFVFFYFKNEMILLAFLKLRKQDFPGTDRLLNKIKSPKSALTRKQQGYYNFLKGIIVSQSNMNEARLWKQNIGSEIQYLQAKAQKESLENNVKSLRAQARKMKLIAPFSEGMIPATNN